MKILFISDIHGSIKNLKTIEQVIQKNNFDKIVVLGDLYYTGPNKDNYDYINSVKVKDFLTKYSERLIVMKGNCDSEVDIKASDFPICSDLSLICVDGFDIYLTHGNKYNVENTRKFNRKGVLVYGHKHYPFIKRQGDMTYICVGSISFPKGGSEASYAVYENKKITIFSINGYIIDEIAL